MRIAVFLSFVFTVYTCKQHGEKTTETDRLHAATAVSTMTANDSATIDFTSDIVVILKARCSPCHFPGGKMYEKLPFDSARTLINHREGILRRIKNEDERKKILAFLALHEQK